MHVLQEALGPDMTQGLCLAVVPCEEDGTVPAPAVPPTDRSVRAIFFQIDPAITVPAPDQLQLKARIERVLRVVDTLFPGPADPANLTPEDLANEAKFRPYYVQLFSLAGVGLVGTNALSEVASPALDGIVTALIDSQGGRVKNRHIQALAADAVRLSIPCTVLYLAMRLAHPWAYTSVLELFKIDPVVLSSFMMIWIGCFIGVVLSYGIRTTNMTIDDLVNFDKDLLRPMVRLLFAGTFAMVLGIALILDIAEFRIGPISSASLSQSPMMAFLFGVLCGVSELALPGAVAKKAADVMRLT
jgi:hypothetical protein